MGVLRLNFATIHWAVTLAAIGFYRFSGRMAEQFEDRRFPRSSRRPIALAATLVQGWPVTTDAAVGQKVPNPQQKIRILGDPAAVVPAEARWLRWQAARAVGRGPPLRPLPTNCKGLPARISNRANALGKQAQLANARGARSAASCFQLVSGVIQQLWGRPIFAPPEVSFIILTEGIGMLRLALLFFIIAVIAGLLGFTGIASVAAGIAKFLFFMFLFLCLLFFVLGLLMYRSVA
jgi:uncharacterized membrane protein YtjA (UPF0391 family)